MQSAEQAVETVQYEPGHYYRVAERLSSDWMISHSIQHEANRGQALRLEYNVMTLEFAKRDVLVRVIGADMYTYQHEGPRF